ncbi:MAG: Gfo/Idh/MocA family oxidoreductase [Chloroflexota bacterium]
MPERRFGFAIVGAGVIAPFHARAIGSLPNASLRVVVDVDTARAGAVAAPLGAETTADLDAALARDDVDVVCVCVPTGLHAEIGCRVARSGKHVITEKPIDVSLAAADRLIQACEENGVKLAVISQMRFLPGVQRVREALTSGDLGTPLLGQAIVHWYRTKEYFESAGWRATWELDGGGSLTNQGVHFVDLLQWLLGPVERVFANCTNRAHDLEVEDVATVLLTFRGGAQGVVQVSTATFPGFVDRLEVYGTGGTAIVEGGETALWRTKREHGETGRYGEMVALADMRAERAEAMEGLPSFGRHAVQISDMLEAIAQGREPLVNGREARKPLAIIQAAYESSRTRREILLDAD